MCFISVKTFSFFASTVNSNIVPLSLKTHGFHNLLWFSCRWCDVRKIQVTKAPPLGSLHVSIFSTGILVALGTMDWRAVDSNMNTTVKNPLSTGWYTLYTHTLVACKTLQNHFFFMQKIACFVNKLPKLIQIKLKLQFFLCRKLLL